MRREISPITTQADFGGVRMRVTLAAIMASTLIMLKWLPGSVPSSLPVVDTSQQGRRRLLGRRQAELPSIFVIPVGNNDQRSLKIEDFGSDYPHTGRFRRNHKAGRRVNEQGGDLPECWHATIAALTASATTVANQKTPQTCSSAPSPSYLRKSGGGNWLSTRSGVVRRSRLHRQQQHRRHHRRTHDDVGQAVRWTAATSQGLKAQASSKWCALSRWSGKRYEKLRRTVSAYRPLVFANPQSIRLTVPLRAAEFATSGIARSTAQLSGLTTEAGWRTRNAFSAVRMYGESGCQCLRKSLLCLGLVRGLDAASIDEDQYELQHAGSPLAHLTDEAVQNVVDVVARDGWEQVATSGGIVVHRRYIALVSDGMPAPPSSWEIVAAATPAVVRPESGGTDDEMPERAPQFACVKATAILNAPPEVVFMLFADNSRVCEYNEHCKRVMDLEILSPDTKITWAASGRMGPFKARDFCTLVHFRTLSDGTLAQVSRPVEHPAAPRSNQYVRSEILVAGNFMRAVPGDPSRTEFLMVTHVNPGGAAETRAGTMLVNSLCARSPVDFIRRLDTAAQKLARQIQEATRADSDRVGDSTVPPSAPSPSSD